MIKNFMKKIYRILKKIPLLGTIIEKNHKRVKRFIDLNKNYPYAVRQVTLGDIKLLLKRKTSMKKLLLKYDSDIAQMVQSFEGKLTIAEIHMLNNYKKTREKSSTKIAKKFISDMLLLPKGGNLTIEIMDAKLPNIVDKLISCDIEKSALFLGDIEENSKKEIKQYCDIRVNSVRSKRAKTFQSRKKLFSPDLATEAFIDIKEILDDNDITFFLVSGTLLGAIRNGGFMENDYDIDLGFFGHNVDIERCKNIIMESENLSIIESYGEYSFAMKHTNGISIDLFDHFLENNALCHRSKIHRWYNTPFSLTSIDFSDTTALIPSNYDLYLSENYGNWRDKVSFYDFSFDTPSVKYSNNIESLEYFSTRMQKAIKGGWRRTFVCSNRALQQAFGMDFMQNYPAVADGDVMDNVDARLRMFVIEQKNLEEDYPNVIKSLINQLSGFNIKLDISIIGDKAVDIDAYKLQAFDFVNMVHLYDTCDTIKSVDLIKYDAIILSKNICSDKFIEYPTVNLYYDDINEIEDESREMIVE